MGSSKQLALIRRSALIWARLQRGPYAAFLSSLLDEVGDCPVCLASCMRLGLPRLPKGCGPKHADCGACLKFRSSVAGAE